MSKISFIILAAGKGSRMQSDKSKVLHEVAGRSLIEHILHMLGKYNSNIHCVTSKSNNQIEDFLISKNLNMQIHQQEQQLGTADAVRVAMNSAAIRSDLTIVLYGDTPFVSDTIIDDLVAKIHDGYSAAVVGFDYDEENQYGKLITQNDKLTKITEAIELGNKNDDYSLCNSGIMAFKTDSLKSVINKVGNNNKKGEYYLTDVVALLNKQGKKVGYVIADYNEVLGINDPLELAFAEEVYQINKISELLLSSVKVIKGESSYFSADCQIDSGVMIEPNCYIGKNVVIKSGTHIKAFSYLEDCIIGENSKIGPFAHLRGDVTIGSNCRVGNFVEIKKSSLGESSKAAHLSYIGDSVLGQNVNIGAGTITCNYDGQNKHQTIIEDDVFIGSNTALIAPVTLRQGSLVGAGSVITKEVKAGELAVARSKQVNIVRKPGK
ncbi:MAG: bifunctional UDP-N-acetylglucosamine diphosphorylase/glucosamine-1-phosphate N-acetyltransferase GlmU [Rickettsiales bacterium]|jgi:bifunctional UDP-N-acetylglucosamine pyrophosphorylase / glucosamine-1-phosphate N-acetyltransferase|nr:bifunctional UDP-N-acetylglucosamine diphosphorylase/glucosamine-1-phosphate N-acetyltransferase GlmU [Rickettsiales bacterium]